MASQKKVLTFIKFFQNPGTIKTFTESCCYWFAKILSTRFSGRVWYNPAQNHFAAMILENNEKLRLYDITGELEITEKWQDWEDYWKVDNLEQSRIVRDYIHKV